MFSEEQHRLDVWGREVRGLLRTPSHSAPHRALLINLTGDCRGSLDGAPYRIVPDAFLEAGHPVASFDLPNHGDLVDDYGAGLTGMAAALADGVDVFGFVAACGRAVIDACLSGGLTPAESVMVAGTSRGGLAALHVMADDRRVCAGAAFAPVTELSALTEFSSLAGTEIVRKFSAMALVEKLAGRAIFLAINRSDPRVGTEHCREFHQALVNAAPSSETTMLEADAEGHGPADCVYHEGARFLLEHVGTAASRAPGIT